VQEGTGEGRAPAQPAFGFVGFVHPDDAEAHFVAVGLRAQCDGSPENDFGRRFRGIGHDGGGAEQFRDRGTARIAFLQGVGLRVEARGAILGEVIGHTRGKIVASAQAPAELGKIIGFAGEGFAHGKESCIGACMTLRWLLVTLLLASPGDAAPRPDLGERYAAPADAGRELLGTRLPEWTLSDWQGSPPLTLAGLRGKVVLVRWWTAPGCPYCVASAEALNGFVAKYRDRGLVVIGAYHHKAESPLTPEHVAAQAKRLGFAFPTAIDRDWHTLRKWWLDRTERGWTSVTFLLGRDGTIRHLHGGGAYYAGEPGYVALEKAIETALRE